MRMNRSPGYIMFMAGLGMLLLSFMFPMATLTIDTSGPTFWGHNPTSISPDTPSPIWGTLLIYVDLRDASGIATALTAITGSDGYTATYSLTYSGTVEYGNPENPIICERWKYTWAVPAKNDVAYSFKCTAKDPLGNTADKTLYGYATTAVDGYFMINEYKVSTESTINLATRTVTFKFVATSGAATIINVNVDILKAGTIINAGYLTKQADGTTWTRTYTFTEDGTFEVNGYFYTTGQTYQRMSVLTQFGEGSPELPQVNTLQILGLASTGIGLLLIFTGRRKSGGG